MSSIKTSIKQPVLVNLLTILVLVAGVSYATKNTKEIMPEVTIPAVMVQTTYPGISARDMEKLVTKPIEDAVANVEDLETIQSITNEGLSFVWLEFHQDTDLNMAVQNVQNEINGIASELPPDAQSPVVTKAKAQTPVIQLTLGAPADADPHLLRKTAKRLKDKLEALPKVSKVDVSGLREREIHVVMDPQRLEAYGLTSSAVHSAVAARNRNLPGGTVRSGSKEVILRPISEYASLQEIENTIIKKDPNGNHVRVKDVADVRDSFEDRVSGGWVDGRPGVVYGIIKKTGADGHDVVEAVRKELRGFEATLPAGYTTKFFGDTTIQVDRTINTLFVNAAMGIALVLALLWVFLGLRNALFAALGIPFSFAGGLVVMYLMGVTINEISLFALIICTGIIVDDAIVVVENAHRYVEKGMSPAKAALLGTKEVMWPVISTIITTIAAFLPLLLMTGVMGEFFSVIPKVVVAVLVASLIEALIVLPSHIADFGKKKTTDGSGTGDSAGNITGSGAKAPAKRPGFDLMGVLKRGYRKSFAWVLRHRYAMVSMAILIAVGSTALALRYKEVVLFGDNDAEMIDIRVEMPQGTSLEATERVLRQVQAVVGELPQKHVKAVLSQSGWSRTNLFPQAGKHRGMVTVILTGTHQRDTTAEQLMARLRPHLARIPGPAKPIEVVKLKHGPPVGDPVAVRLQGDNLERLVALAEEVERELSKIPGVKDIGRDYHRGSPELSLVVDEERAALHGLGPAQVNQQVALAYMGSEATKFRKDNEEVAVKVRFPRSLRRDPTAVATLPLLGTSSAEQGLGTGVRSASSDAATPRALSSLSLGSVTRLESSRAAAAIRRRNRKRTITVTANLDKASGLTSSGVNKEAQGSLAALIKANPDVNFTFGGEFEKTNESVESLFIAFLVAILAIYLILGAQFRSFTQPVVVLLAVPLSIIGVVVGFFVTGGSIDLIALMGVVGLAGIVVNDSLILVDFINERRRNGMARDEAIKEAGELRLRPILLTSVTTVFGMLPLAMGWGGSVAELAPMATAIAWGLGFATLLTLYIVPSAYAMVDDAVKGVYRLFGKVPKWVDEEQNDLDDLDQLDLEDAITKALPERSAVRDQGETATAARTSLNTSS